MEEIKPTPIPLKLKYRVGGKSRYSSGHGGNNNPAKQHRQLTERDKALHLAQPNKVMVIRGNGPARMITVPK